MAKAGMPAGWYRDPFFYAHMAPAALVAAILLFSLS